jgi:cyclase
MGTAPHDHHPGPARVTEVSQDVYAYIQPNGTWFINNAAFLVARDGVTSIDTCSTEKRTQAYLDAIASVTSRPVRTLVNTHHHGDHTYGNCLLRGATIVAHERTREEILAAGKPAFPGIFDPVEWGDVEITPPFLTYSDRVTLWNDDLRCEIRHVGIPAHTTNDSIVWLPDRSVLFAGDLIFNGGTPFILMGSVAGAIEALERVLKPLAPAVIVPGHGEPCGPEAIDFALGYLRFVQDVARRGVTAGISPLQAALSTDLGAYAGLSDPERIVGNLHRAYADQSGPGLGAPVDILAAFTDMVTYNGGKPLTCHA